MSFTFIFWLLCVIVCILAFFFVEFQNNDYIETGELVWMLMVAAVVALLPGVDLIYSCVILLLWSMIKIDIVKCIKINYVKFKNWR